MGRAVPDPLFGLAPDGVYRAPLIALRAVGSYPTFSPLPGEPGGLFSVALAVDGAFRRRRPRVSHPKGTGYAASCPVEFGLSSPGKPEATLRPPGAGEHLRAYHVGLSRTSRLKLIVQSDSRHFQKAC